MDSYRRCIYQKLAVTKIAMIDKQMIVIVLKRFMSTKLMKNYDKITPN